MQMATEQAPYEASENEHSSLQGAKSQQSKGAKEQAGPAAPGTKRKRQRKNTIENKPVGADNDSEDIKLHVDADWSDDDKDDKEPTTKRVAAEGDESGPVAVKKAAGGPLENFTVRAVVTRKDVDVIFEHRAGAKEELEAETSTSVTIVAGKDDPDIVVDRVLIIKGPIEGVTAAYKVITQGMLAIKQSTAAAASIASDGKQKQPEKQNSEGNQGEDQDSEMEDTVAATAAAAAATDDGYNERDGEEDSDNDDGNDQNKGDDDENSDGGDGESHDGGSEAAIDAADSAADASKVAKPAASAEEADAEANAKAANSADSTGAGTSNVNGNGNGNGNGKKDTPNDRVTLRVLVPHKCVGSIMGHGGKTINHIRDSASVSIHTSENTLPRSTERIVAVIGAPESIQKAIGLIAQALTKDMVSYSSPECYVPAANLPSAMTVETHFRKRKDNNNNNSSNKRFSHGHNDHHGNSRGHGNKGGSFRHHQHHNNNSNNSGGNSQGGGYAHNRHQNHHGGNQRPHGLGAGYNRGNSGNAGGRNDRFNRNSNDRQGGRPRAPNAMSQVNRLPVGSGGGGSGLQSQYNNSYRGGSGHSGNNRGAAAPNMAYGGYVIPPTTSYPAYGSQGAGATSVGNGGMGGGRYGGGMAPVSPASAGNAYGGGFASAPAPYQFASPVGYAYAAAPVQGVYGNRPVQSPQQYPMRNNRQHMPHQQQQQHQQQQHQQQYQGQYQQQNQHYQSSMAMGGVAPAGAVAGGAAASAGQTIQKIYVSADKVGAVIGRRGETINEIRQSTNARVDIQDSAHGNKERLIVITGGYEQVHSAYYMIQNKLATARPTGMRP